MNHERAIDDEKPREDERAKRKEVVEMESQRAMGNLVRLCNRFLTWLWWDKKKRGWSYEKTRGYGPNSREG